MREWGLCNLHKVSGSTVQKFVQHFPLTKSARYGIMVISAARQSCAARHYITKSIFCQVKISKNQKKLVSVFMDTSCQKVSAFMDTYPTKRCPLLWTLIYKKRCPFLWTPFLSFFLIYQCLVEGVGITPTVYAPFFCVA